MLFPPQPQSKLADFYAAADVVLVPSRSESFGLVALEAQACGTPVVAAAVGGLPYVVEDGRSGFLVEGHDPGDHADRLLQILARSRPPQSAFGEEAARSALRFTWDATTDQMVSVYERCCAAVGRASGSVTERLAMPADLQVHRRAVTRRHRSIARLVTFLSLFSACPLPAHSCSDLRIRRS